LVQFSLLPEVALQSQYEDFQELGIQSVRHFLFGEQTKNPSGTHPFKGLVKDALMTKNCVSFSHRLPHDQLLSVNKSTPL
jgi:hypothetical protein